MTSNSIAIFYLKRKTFSFLMMFFEKKSQYLELFIYLCSHNIFMVWQKT